VLTRVGERQGRHLVHSADGVRGVTAPQRAPAEQPSKVPPERTDAYEAVPNSVLGKARLIIEAFGSHEQSLSLRDLVERTGVSKPSAYRLCADLIEWGLIERAGTRYRLGLRLFELGQRVPRQRLLRDAALPWLEDLYTATGETVHCAVLDGREVVYVEKISGHRDVAWPSHVAGRMPLHCTATGKVILAFSPPTLLEEVLRHGLRRRTPHTTVSPHLLRTQLEHAGREGYAVEIEETRLGHMSVSVPVFGLHDVLAGAISVTSTPCSSKRVARYLPSLRHAAAGTGMALRAGAPRD